MVLENGFDAETERVTGDSRDGARKATEHLPGLGHLTVWHIAGPGGRTSADHRLSSWRSTLEAAGAPVPEPLFGDRASSGAAPGR